MTLTITFTKDIRIEKILHHLFHLKKDCPAYRSYVPEVDEANGRFILTELSENIVKQCTFKFDGRKLTFEYAEEDRDLTILFKIYLVESLDEPAIIECENSKAIYDGNTFYMVDYVHNKYYQMSNKLEILQEASISRIPDALRIAENYKEEAEELLRKARETQVNA